MRQEQDSLGAIQLPSDCLYGARTARCLENLSFSGSRLLDYPDLVRSLALVKKACALANAHAQTISAEHNGLIVRQCDRLLAGEFADQFPVDMLHGGGYIAFNVNINEVIANLANIEVGNQAGDYSPIDPKSHVNCGQSTADVCHTAVRLTVLSIHEEFQRAIDQLELSLTNLHALFKPVTTVARTCLQDAMPVSLGEMFGAYASFIARRKIECARAVDALVMVNLGGTVIGNGLGASSQYVRVVVEKLNMVSNRNLRLRPNLYDAAQNIDDLVAVSSQMRLMAEGLIKIAKDIRLLSSGPQCGFGEIILPPVQEGSSFFAGKINPVVPETLINACMQVLGCDRAASAALEHAELNLNVFESVAAKNVFDQLAMLTKAIKLFDTKCISDIKAHTENCNQYAISVSSTEPVRV